MTRLLWTVLCIATLAGCGASYRTEHRLTPPGDAQGQACVARCTAQQSKCQRRVDRAADDEYEFCEMKRRQDVLQCGAQGNQLREPCQETVCYRGDIDHDACDTPFRDCFQACGGTVQAEQVCTSGCGRKKRRR